MEIDARRLINPNDGKGARTGADVEEVSPDDPDVSIGSSVAPNVRLYPAGKRLSKGESAKESAHSSQDERGGGAFGGIPTRAQFAFLE